MEELIEFEEWFTEFVEEESQKEEQEMKRKMLDFYCQKQLKYLRE